MKQAVSLILVALTAALVLPTSPTHAQVELTEIDPPDGAELEAPPEVVRICFSEPVVIDDPEAFDFAYIMPDGRALGRRAAFQSDGLCADVFPGLPEERPAGEYSIEWRLTAAESGEESIGTIRFEVTESSTRTPAPSPTQGGTPAADETPPPATGGGLDAGDEGGDDGPDILLLALITTAVVGGAAVLFTFAYLLRRRIGYDIHRPPEGGEDDDHH